MPRARRAVRGNRACVNRSWLDGLMVERSGRSAGRGVGQRARQLLTDARAGIRNAEDRRNAEGRSAGRSCPRGRGERPGGRARAGRAVPARRPP